MTTTSVQALSLYIDQLLEVQRYADIAHNGLQIESPISGVSKVGFAVDAGYSVMEQAADANCQLLIVHHGVLWGGTGPVTGPWARKLQLCMTRGLSLYASHLPLDGHPTLGNAAQLGALIGVSEIQPCFTYKGSPIGVSGTLTTPRTPHEIASQVSHFEGGLTPPLVLPFGSPQVTRIGIATGSATSVIPECAALGIDLLLTGESKQEAYHLAKEHHVSVICMGHYASETFGVRALERVLQRDFRVETCWISEPTGI